MTLSVIGCASTGTGDRSAIKPSDPTTITIESTHTVPGIGAGQGAATLDGMLVLYGDADTGVIEIYDNVDFNTGPLHTIELTRNGFDQISHPTGFAHHPEFGTFVGNTVNQAGTIFHIDLARAIKDGDLDRAIIAIIDDDLGHNGTRPEFVRIGETWLMATADNGDDENTLRLYDPKKLAISPRTSISGVLVHDFPCPPFVQTIEWLDDIGMLVLVQNQTAGLGYRLTFCTVDEESLNQIAVLDLDEPTDELEGFVLLDDERILMVSSASESNVHLGSAALPVNNE